MKAGMKQFFVFWRPLPLLWAAVSLINSVFMTCFLHKAPEADARFFGATMLLPLGVGMTLALIAGRVIHQPAIMLLPGARLFYRKRFLWTAAVLGAALVALANGWTGEAGTVRSVAGLVVIGLSAGLMWEPLSRWYGSSWLLALVALAMGAAGAFAGEIREVATANPGWFQLAGAVAFFCASRVFFAKERVRGRAMTVMLFCGADMKMLSRTALAQHKWSGRDWTHGPIGATDHRRWRAAFAHEWFGAMSWPRACMVVLWFLIVWGMVALGMLASHVKATQQPFTGAVLAREFYSLIWSVGSKGTAMPLLPLVTCLGVLFLFPFVLNYPRAAALYPASRKMHAKLAIQVAMRRTILFTAAGVAAVLAVSWLAGILAGEGFRWRPSSLLAVPLAFLPVWPWIAGLILPLSHWSDNPVRGLWTLSGLIFLAGGVAGAVGAFFLSLFAVELLTWAGVAGLAVAMLPGWWWLSARVKRFYIFSDLIMRERV